MKYEVLHDRLVVNDKPVRFVPTKHVGGRIEPVAIVAHDTAGGPPGDSVGWLTTDPKNKGKASAHLIILRDANPETGEGIIQLADFDRRTNHAGDSIWNGAPNCNGRMIGIELQNPGAGIGTPDKCYFPAIGRTYGAEHGIVQCKTTQWHKAALWMPYTEGQMRCLELTIAALAATYTRITEVVGHHHISPGRKVDPTPLMDWARLRRALPARAPAIPVAAIREAQEALVALGYHLGKADGFDGPRTRAAVRAFQEQNGLVINGQLDVGTRDLLRRGVAGGAKPMPTGSREEAVAASEGQTTGTRALKWTAKIGLSVKAGEAVADALENIEAASEALKVAEEGKSIIERAVALGTWVLKWAITPKGVAILGTMVVIGAGWAAVKWFERWRAGKARNGELLEA